MEDDDTNTFTISIPEGNIDGLTVGGTIDTTAYSTTYSSSGGYSIDSTLTTPGTFTFDTYNDFDSGISVNEGDLNIHKDGDVIIGGKSLKTFMDKMEKRLSILQPDPEKLEKFEALRKAYEHYKTVEALCIEDADDNNEKTFY